jgi:DNA-directed RNA polymerase specialized sigma subunit
MYPKYINEQLDSYNLLYKDVKNYSIPPLSREKQIELITQYKEDNNYYARDQLILSNLKLVEDRVFNFVRKRDINPEETKDYISYGFESAIKSLDTYDLTKGDATVTSWIRNIVDQRLLLYYMSKESLNNKVSTSISRIKKENLEQIAEQFYYKEFNAYPKSGQTYTFVYKGKDVTLTFGDNKKDNVLSLDDPIHHLDNNTNAYQLGDFIGNDIEKYQQFENSDQQQYFKQINSLIYDILLPIEREVVFFYHVKQLKFNQIIYHITPTNNNQWLKYINNSKNVVELYFYNDKGEQIGSHEYNIYSCLKDISSKVERNLPCNFIKSSNLEGKPVTNYFNYRLFLECTDDVANVKVFFNKKLKAEGTNIDINLNLNMGYLYTGANLSNMYHKKILNKIRSNKKLILNNYHEYFE